MTCPDCGTRTITTPDGRHLNPDKSRLGQHLPDGTQITPNELREGQLRAHHLHYCPPTTNQPEATQASLF